MQIGSENTIQNNFLRISISQQGGELQSVTGSNGIDYLWNGDPKYWKGRALNLFPYIGRLTEGKYIYNGEQYHMPIHGFLPESQMEYKQTTQTSMVYSLEDNAITYAMYPFRFRLQICYELDDNILHIRYIVENRDSKTIYFGIGGHPGFCVPLEKGLDFSDYRLAFQEDVTRVLMSDSCFCTGGFEPLELSPDKELGLQHGLFDHDAIITKYSGESVKLYSPKGRHSITVKAPQMPYWGFWHRPHTDAPYICMEPWSSLPSRHGIVENIDKQSDLIALETGETYQNDWTIQFD